MVWGQPRFRAGVAAPGVAAAGGAAMVQAVPQAPEFTVRGAIHSTDDMHDVAAHIAQRLVVAEEGAQ